MSTIGRVWCWASTCIDLENQFFRHGSQPPLHFITLFTPSTVQSTPERILEEMPAHSYPSAGFFKHRAEPRLCNLWTHGAVGPLPTATRLADRLPGSIPTRDTHLVSIQTELHTVTTAFSSRPTTCRVLSSKLASIGAWAPMLLCPPPLHSAIHVIRRPGTNSHRRQLCCYPNVAHTMQLLYMLLKSPVCPWRIIQDLLGSLQSGPFVASCRSAATPDCHNQLATSQHGIIL